MPISTRCPKCGKTFEVADKHLGQRAQCKACAAIFLIRNGDGEIVLAKAPAATKPPPPPPPPKPPATPKPVRPIDLKGLGSPTSNSKPVAANPAVTAERFTKAQLAIQNNNFDYAVSLLKLCVLDAPANREYARAFIVALAQERRHRMERDGKDFVIQLVSPRAMTLLKDCIAGERWPEVRSHALDILKLNPTNDEALQAMAQACQQQGYDESAWVYLEASGVKRPQESSPRKEAVVADHNSPDPAKLADWLSSAQRCLAQQAFHGAAISLQSCVKHSPANPEYARQYIAAVRMHFENKLLHKKELCIGIDSSTSTLLRELAIEKRWGDLFRLGVGWLLNRSLVKELLEAIGQACLEQGYDESAWVYLEAAGAKRPQESMPREEAAAVAASAKAKHVEIDASEHQPIASPPKNLPSAAPSEAPQGKVSVDLSRKEAQQTIGQYGVVRLLGQGGMGEVYEAIQPGLDRKVALKLLPPRFTNNTESVERFRREAKAVARLNHPNIITIYEYGQVGPQHFLAMEFIDGPSLEDVLRKEAALDSNRALALILQAVHGLQHAWEAGIVHRDIKPANLLLTRTGAVKVADFGLASIADTDRNTRTGAGMGTPYYMSPEQFYDAKNVDLRGDIYSLGATFFHLVTGRVPFEGSSPIEVGIKVSTAPLPPVRDVNPLVPDSVASVIERMLARNADDRYQSGTELISAIQDASQPRVVIAGQSPRQDISPRPKPSPIDSSHSSEPFRMRIDEESRYLISVLEKGIPIRGDVEQGSVKVGDVLECVTSSGICRKALCVDVRDIHREKSLTQVKAGDSICVNVVGDLNKKDLEFGSVLQSIPFAPPTRDGFDLRIPDSISVLRDLITVLKLLVGDGDTVATNQVVAEITLGKRKTADAANTIQVRCPHAGRVTKVHVSAGEVIPSVFRLLTIKVS